VSEECIGRKMWISQVSARSGKVLRQEGKMKILYLLREKLKSWDKPTWMLWGFFIGGITGIVIHAYLTNTLFVK
jgi:hypothetical protein